MQVLEYSCLISLCLKIFKNQFCLGEGQDASAGDQYLQNCCMYVNNMYANGMVNPDIVYTHFCCDRNNFDVILTLSLVKTTETKKYFKDYF